MATARDLAFGRDILPFTLVAGLNPPILPETPTSSSVFQTLLALPSVAPRRMGSSPTWNSATSTTSVSPTFLRKSSAPTVFFLMPRIQTQSCATIPSTLTVETVNMFVSIPLPVKLTKSQFPYNSPKKVPNFIVVFFRGA